MVFGILLLIIVLSSSTHAAELYLVRTKAGSRIVLTSERRIPYVLKQEVPGRATLILHGVRLKAGRIERLKDPLIKSITLIPERFRTLVKITLAPNHIIKPVETFPPFKLTLIPERVKPQFMVKKMLTNLYKRRKCDLFIYNYSRLITSQLTPNELLNFTKMHLECALEERQWRMALEDIRTLSRFKLPEKEAELLSLKKIELYLKVKDYDNALAEGKLFIKKYSDPLRDLAASYMARALLKLGRVDDAILLLKSVIKSRPDSPYILYLYRELAKAYYRKANYLGAYLLLKEVQKKDRKVLEEDAEALYALGSSAFRIGKTEEAKAELLRTINLFPETPETAKALALMGEIYRQKGNWKLALWFYKLCTSMFPNTKAAAVSKLKVAQYYEKIGKYRDALNLYTETGILYPNMPDVIEVALYRKGVMLLKLGRYEEAIRTFQDFILKVPQSKYVRDAEMYIQECEFKIAERKYKRKQYEEALKLFARFAVKYPQNPFTPRAIELAGDSIIKIVEGKYKRGDCFGILFFWDGYKNFFPKKAEKGIPLFHVAQCLFKRSRSKEAVELLEWIFNNISSRFPMFKELLNQIATYYFDTVQYQKAEKFAEILMGNSTAKETPLIHFRTLKLYFVKKEYKKMMRLIKKMESEGEPEKYLIKAYLLKAVYFLEKNNTWASMKYLNMFLKSPLSISLYPDDYQYAEILLARILFNRNQIQEADKSYLHYANTFPSGNYTPEAYFMVGLINQSHIGNHFWELCLSRYPKSHWSKEIKAILLARSVRDEIYQAVRSAGAEGSPQELH